MCFTILAFLDQNFFFFEVLFNDWNVNVFNNFLVEFEKNHNMIE